MATLGTVKKDPKTGKYSGQLKTLSFTGPIEIVPVTKKVVPNGPDFIITSKGVEIGAAWTRKGQRSGKDYVSASISAPEVGTMYFNLGHAAGSVDPNEFALIYNAPNK
jgi:uncharacterized protein (DUF736 family)